MMNYGLIVAPLTQLLCKDAFQWTDDATLAFEKLKQVMVTMPMLALSDFSLPFVIETNASGIGVGVVLAHKQRPIAFFSQALSPRALMKWS